MVKPGQLMIHNRCSEEDLFSNYIYWGFQTTRTKQMLWRKKADLMQQAGAAKPGMCSLKNVQKQ